MHDFIQNDGKKWQPFTIFAQTIIHLVCPPKFCITVVSNFSWVLQSSRGKSETMIIKIWAGVNKLHYGLRENGVSGKIRIIKNFQISDEMGKLCSLVKYGRTKWPPF